MRVTMGKLETVLLTVAAAGVVGTLLLPASGSLVLLRELVGIVPILAGGLWLVKVMVMIYNQKGWKDMLLLACVAAVLLGVSVLKIGRTAADATQGSQRAVLYNCDVETTMGTKGIFSLSYKLRGVDASGERYRLYLSGSDAQKLKDADTVTVEYYAHTKRVVVFSDPLIS